MRADEYRKAIRMIVRNSINKHLTGLSRKKVDDLSVLIAVNIHARFYGANVGGVDSPLWRDILDDVERGKPTQDAADILKEGMEK